MTELWLVRHGQTDWNVAGRYQGQRDIPLNAEGLAQAAALAAGLDGQRFAAIYSSDLMRARQTADALSAHTGLPVQLDARLREIHQGEWEGQYIREVVAVNPRARHDALVDPSQARAPGGESVLQVLERVSAAADEIAARHSGKRVLVVSHGLALATLIVQTAGAEITGLYGLIPDNAVPTVVHWPPIRRMVG